MMLNIAIYLILTIIVLLVPYVLLRPWYTRWGATPNEARADLPGDEIAASPQLQSTRAITINAPPERIWPWIAQIGQERGGFYSYQWLENLLGCKIKNADRVVQAWQQVAPGDTVRLAPGKAPYFVVDSVETGRALVLRSPIDEANPDGGTKSSWSFILKPAETGSTRLIVRTRTAYKPNLLNVILWRVFTEPASFIMEQKMLRGIRQRAEMGVPKPGGMAAPV